MFFNKAIFCLLCVSIQFCAPASILDLEFPFKCNIDDSECLKNLSVEMFQKAKGTGIPELNIPVMDPYKIKDGKISVLNMVTFTLTDGLAEGAMSCEMKKFESVFEMNEKYIASETFCESVRMSGSYMTEFGPIALTLLGKNTSADGTGSIQIDNMTMKMKIPYEVLKLDDGEIYLVPVAEKAEYSNNDIEKITFNVNNVIFGGRDVSERFTNYMNNNWKMMNRSFGKIVSDKVMQTFFVYMKMAFLQIPANKMIEDISQLEPHVKVESNKRRVIDF